MPITEEERQSILTSYRWIKVKRFVDDPSLTWEERYKLLEEHHTKETSFLIDKIREMVK
jgi:hypothetical protein